MILEANKIARRESCLRHIITGKDMVAGGTRINDKPRQKYAWVNL